MIPGTQPSSEAVQALNGERYDLVRLRSGRPCVIQSYSREGDPSPLVVWVVPIEDPGAVGGVRFEVLAKEEFGEAPSTIATCVAPRKPTGGEG